MSQLYQREQYEPANIHKMPKCDFNHISLMCRVFAAEALGLGMIVFIVAVHGAEGQLTSPVSGPVTAAAAFAVAVWTVGPVSGPQITAILSLALFVTRRVNFVYCILGVLGQLCGALVGISLASRLVPGLSEKDGLNLHTPGVNVTDGQAFGLEIICSFLLIICCLSTLDEFRKDPWVQGHVTAFPMLVFLLILTLAAILVKPTGCGMNPMASLAAAIFNNRYDKIWIYLVAPFIGSIIAVLLWEMMISDAASVERLKHWFTDPYFDRTKDYKRLKWESEHEVYNENIEFTEFRSNPKVRYER